MKNRQHNGQKKKYKQRSTKHTHKTKDWLTRTPLKTGVDLLVTNPVIKHFSLNREPICKIILTV